MEGIDVDVVRPILQTSVPSNYFTESADSIDSDIKRYLSKPVEMLVGTFNGSDGPLTFAPWIDFPRALIKKDLYYQKLKGYLGFRATIHLKLQVNGQRFQQGRYMLCAVPVAGAPLSGRTSGYADYHAVSKVQRSQLPHAEIDIATQTSCELVLPYSSVYDYYDMQLSAPDTNTPTTHLVRIFPYSSIESASSTNAKFTLWAWFEDIELIGQALPVVFQSNLNKSQPANEEAKKANIGPVESVALAVSKASTILGKVPMLSSYTTPIKWVSDSVAGLANIYGWSAPRDSSHTTRVKHNVYAFATNVDKYDNSMPLGLTTTNSVSVLPGVGGINSDDMDIVSLCSRFSWIKSETWTTGLGEGNLILSLNAGMWPITPLTAIYPAPSSGTITLYHYSPAQYVSTHFAFYRGSIVFRLKFVKTEFHSGRISIEFNPTSSDYSSALITDDVAPYLYRDIVDIRGLVDYTFEVPFVHNSPYLPTDFNVSNYGKIEVRVVDPLIAPTSVAQSIGVIVEHAWGDDIEFAVPNKKLSCAFDDNAIVFESGFPTLGGMKRRQAQLDTAEACIGEKIVNLRSLLKRFVSTPKKTVSPPTSTGTLSEVMPFGAEGIEETGLTFSVDRYSDVYSEFCHIFTYSRGGVRWKIYSDAATNLRAILAKLMYYGVNVSKTKLILTTSSPSVSGSDGWTTNSCAYAIDQSMSQSGNQFIEVEIPQYSMTDRKSVV